MPFAFLDPIHMTLYVPLSGTGVPPASPSTLKHTRDHTKHLDRAARAIAKAKRIVVVSGELAL